MKLEYFQDITIGYMRRTGQYGLENKVLMEELKSFLRRRGLFGPQTVILGIALDNPAQCPSDQLRYDVGVVLHSRESIGLRVRTIEGGPYAVFEVSHTAEGVSAFWQNLTALTQGLAVDWGRPILERYAARMVAQHLCELCVPLKSL